MKVSISKVLKDLYQELHKNYEYALERLMKITMREAMQ